MRQIILSELLAWWSWIKRTLAVVGTVSLVIFAKVQIDGEFEIKSLKTLSEQKAEILEEIESIDAQVEKSSKGAK